MKFMVTDNPKDNIENALNLFFIKDRETWVRGYGPGPEYGDISLYDLVRQIKEIHGLEIDCSDDGNMSFALSEALFDGIDTKEGVVALLYTAGWAFAELRAALAKYEAKPNPFLNDPFALVWRAFKNLYPDKDCEIMYDQHQGDEHDEHYGFTSFPEDGGIPQICIYAEHNVNIQVETLGHELAHVAVGVEHDHDEAREAAFDAIFQEYNRLGDEMFGLPKDEEPASDCK